MAGNDKLVSNLQVLLDAAKTSKNVNDKFRVKAYANAIKQIKNLNVSVTSGKQAMELTGVGKKIADKIQEIIDTGELHQVTKMDPEKLTEMTAITTFTKIWGVGPVKAKELYDSGARTIADVKKRIELLTDNQKVGLTYYDDLQKRAPRESVSVIADKITTFFDKNRGKYPGLSFKVCGSFRRRQATCGDMDVLITYRSVKFPLADIVEDLTNAGVLKITLGLGETKYMGICFLPTEPPNVKGQAFRIDIEIVPPEEWPFALLYFTGSGNFNEQQRLIAKKKGYSLSEHGLKNVETGEYLAGFYCELDIFRWLGMEYLPPWQR